MKNNNFKSFLLKLMLFFVTLGITDFVIGSLLRKYYFKQKGGFEFLTSYALEETDAEVLIFGSSRAVNLYNTLLFEEQLKMSCYNTGRYGHPIFYHYAILHANLKRHTPKLAILSFDAGNFSVNQSSYDQLSVLLPYYQDHPEIRKVIDLKGPFEKLKMVSAIYPYNSMIIPIIAGNSERSKFKFANIKGYIPLTKEIKGPLKNIDYTKESVLDSVKKIIFFSYWFQSFAVYENGKLQRVGPISMGKKSTPTPTGLFHTNWKSKSTVSTINDEWVMNWYFNLENKLGVSMHEFELPGYPASHACIRLLQADAFWFYYWADSWKLESSTKIKSLGTPVIIYGEYPFGQIKPWRRIINNSLQVNVEEEIEREIKNFIPLILERQTSLDSLSVK